MSEAAAYLYESEDGSKELILDCNGEHARRLLEQGYTETPLFSPTPTQDTKAGRALCQLFYDNSDAILTALSSPPDEAMVERALEVFNGGMVNVPDDGNQRGYTTWYRPKEAMRAALTSLKDTTTKE